MEKLYNIRMRSSENQQHISGAERMVHYEGIHNCVASMIDRSFHHKRGKPDFISIKIEKIKEEVKVISPISTIENIENYSVNSALCAMRKILKPLNLQASFIQSLYEIITTGTSISGALLIDIHSQERLDAKENGVRVSRLDWQEKTKEDFIRWNPDCNSERKLEAIALASKVQHSGVIAELCCSDDPHYTTGYVTLKNTYTSIPHMKEENSASGGRIFLVDSEQTNVEEIIQFLEQTPVIVGGKIG